MVDPFSSLPAYYALVSRGKVKEVYTCFSVNNIAKNGQEWVFKQLEEELGFWENINPDLKKSLNSFVRKPKFWFKEENHIEQSYDRFIFIRVF